MNSMKTYRRNQEEKQWQRYEERKKEEEARVAAMTPEERDKYEETKRERLKRTAQLLGLMGAISGPYSNLK